MIQTQLPYNGIITSMSYKREDDLGGVLTLSFKRGKLIQNRSYKASRELAYKMYYSFSGKIVLDIFNNQIKNKLTLIEVK
jgi:hypothetical protein